MDGHPRQNPAYRPAKESPRSCGEFLLDLDRRLTRRYTLGRPRDYRRFVSSSAQRHHPRATLEEVAKLYDRVRPTYPQQAFDDLVALAQLPEAARIVEIGCGTGQATLPLAERGYRITCLELG